MTITHPKVERYFLTIPEAVGLVIKSSTIAKGGELFILDMKDPVKIVDIAKRVANLYGKTAFENNESRSKPIKSDQIEIVYVGLRPGEKLYEELVISGEKHPTSVAGIIEVKEAPVSLDNLNADIKELTDYAKSGNEHLFVEKLKSLDLGYLSEH